MSQGERQEHNSFYLLFLWEEKQFLIWHFIIWQLALECSPFQYWGLPVCEIFQNWHVFTRSWHEQPSSAVHHDPSAVTRSMTLVLPIIVGPQLCLIPCPYKCWKVMRQGCSPASPLSSHFTALSLPEDRPIDKITWSCRKFENVPRCTESNTFLRPIGWNHLLAWPITPMV